MRLRLLPVLFLVVLSSLLQSCGGFTTIVSVYPDGTADLEYVIEAPTGKMPDFEQMGKGEWSDIFKKDQYLSQEPGKLMDSLMRFTVAPMLMKLQNRGQIRHFTIKDTNEFTSKRVNITLQLRSYEDVGRVHSAFRREAPVLDSILRKLTGKSALSKNDSIAIINWGDSLELQLHNFVTIPEPEGTREERIANGKRMFDSLILVFSDSSSIFSMFGDAGPKMVDSMRNMRATLTDDYFDSLGLVMSMGSSMKELFKPKTILRAPVYLSDNREVVGYAAVNANPTKGTIEFTPGMFLDQSEITDEPYRQRFKLHLPSRTTSTQAVRDEWRSVMRWCEECETSFTQVPSKAPTSGMTFHELKPKLYLVEVSCGNVAKNNARLFYMIDDRERLPTIAIHQFPTVLYMDDPAYEFSGGMPHMLKRPTDILVGKIAFNKATSAITVDRGSAKEVFDLSNGSPVFQSGQYKDRAGKWLKFEEYISASEIFSSSTCVEGVQVSEQFELPPVEY